MWNMKKNMIQINLFTKYKQTHKLQKQSYVCQKGKVWGKDKLGLWDYYNIYTLLYISRQQRATVEYRETIQYSVVTYMGKESEKE